MEQQEENTEETKDRHPLITIGILTVGTQLGTALIQRMGRHPALLFAMGLGAGIYSYKNRKEILDEASHLKNQTKNLFSKKSETE
jgi:hypothetical protein